MPRSGELGDDPETGPIRPPSYYIDSRISEDHHRPADKRRQGGAKRGITPERSYPDQDHKTVTVVCCPEQEAKLESFTTTSSELWAKLVAHSAYHRIANDANLSWSTLQKLLSVWKKDWPELHDLPWEVGVNVVREVDAAFSTLVPARSHWARSKSVAVKPPPNLGLYFAYPQISQNMIRLSKLGWIEFTTSRILRVVLQSSGIRPRSATVYRKNDQWYANISFKRVDPGAVEKAVFQAKNGIVTDVVVMAEKETLFNRDGLEVEQEEDCYIGEVDEDEALIDAVLRLASFSASPAWQVSTAALIARLKKEGIPMHPRKLAQLMRTVGIHPLQLKIGGKYVQGYDRYHVGFAGAQRAIKEGEDD